MAQKSKAESANDENNQNCLKCGNWLEKIDDSQPITSLLIAGTHHSAAYASPDLLNKFTQFLWKTQKNNIRKQLDFGVRFFDFHVRCDANSEIKVYREDVYLGMFKTYISTIQDFLKQNPQQFVIVQIQKQQGSLNPTSSGKKILQEIKESSKEKLDNVYSNKGQSFAKHMPTVGELRGKILILQANVTPSTEISKKLAIQGSLKITLPLNNPTCSDWQTFSIKKLSMQSSESAQKQQLLQWLKNDSQGILKFGHFYSDLLPGTNSKRYHQWFQEGLSREPGQAVGFVMFDFVDQSLCDSVIRTNL